MSQAEDRTETRPESSIRNVSDTALWAAAYRARETERPDALFRDHLARRLAAERGLQIANKLAHGDQDTWAWVTRTWLFDRFITAQVEQGTDMVVNLAAGLDARPYRLALPSSLQWIEVDLPEILTYKEEVLAGEKPVCALERIRLDLTNLGARRELFGELAGRAAKCLIITEGLLIYFTEDEVRSLAQDLAEPPSFERWLLEVASPGLLRLLQKRMGSQLSQAGAPFKFGPKEGPKFFTRYGWKPLEVRSFLKTAARLRRLPFFLRLMALLPESNGAQGSRPWSGACLFAKQCPY